MSEKNSDVEMACIGAMLLDAPRVVPLARNRMMLAPEAWMDRHHQKIIETIYTLIAEAKVVDVLTVTEKLEPDGSELTGGLIYLNRCIEAVPSETHAEYYLDLLRQKHILRKIKETCRAIENDAAISERGDALLKEIPGKFSAIIDEAIKEKSNKEVLGELLVDWKKAKEGGEQVERKLITPWKTLNKAIGMVDAGLIVIAGRPSQGKTTVEDCWSIYMAQRGKKIGRVTLDMTKKMLLARSVCRLAGVSLPKLAYGFAGESQIQQVKDAIQEIIELPLFINDSDRDLNGICTWARMMKIRHGLDLLTIDYVQQVQTKSERGWSENQIITAITQKLKALSFELEIPVILLSQLSREVERNERKPKLSDLRGSGSLEQDATVVMFVYKDEEQAEEKETKRQRPMWLDVQKHQNGECGMIPMWFYPSYFRFDETTENYPTPAPKIKRSNGEEEALECEV